MTPGATRIMREDEAKAQNELARMQEQMRSYQDQLVATTDAVHLSKQSVEDALTQSAREQQLIAQVRAEAAQAVAPGGGFSNRIDLAEEAMNKMQGEVVETIAIASQP